MIPYMTQLKLVDSVISFLTTNVLHCEALQLSMLIIRLYDTWQATAVYIIAS